MSERKIVVPGEVIIEGENYLPGEGTQKRGDSIVSIRYGLVNESENLVKVIALSGRYFPRRGNVVIGIIVDVIHNGWIINIGTPENAFLSVNEFPRYVNKEEIGHVMKIGDVVVAKIWGVNRRGVDLSLKSRGLGKIEEGIVVEVNPQKVPRIIGKEGSMVNLIKEKTGCTITVGQNGIISIKGEDVEKELFAKKAINFVVERSFVKGLTEEVNNWFKE